MKTATNLLIACLAFGFAAQASAQSISPAWDAYRKQAREQHRQQAAPTQTGNDAAPEAPAAPASTSGTPSPVVPPLVDATPPSAVPHSAERAEPVRSRHKDPHNLSGAFIAAQAGTGEVYEGIKQDMYGVSAGYRWGIGSVTSLGVEAAAGRLEEKVKDGFPAPTNMFYSLGATARFNFGQSPLFAVARLGYWTSKAEVPYYYGGGYWDGNQLVTYSYYENHSTRVYGAYAGLGLGVDLGRHVSLALTYSGYIYSEDASSRGQDDDFDVNYADTLNFGVEVRF